MFACEHSACSSKPCCDLVKNKKNIILFRKFARTINVAHGLINHPCRPLHKGFHNEGAGFLMVFFNHLLKPLRTKITIFFFASFKLILITVRSGGGKRFKKK